MANIVDTLVTRYTMDNKDYKAGAAGVSSALKTIGLDAMSAQDVLGRLIGVVKAAAVAYVGFATAVVGFGVAAFRQYAEYDGLVKSLEAIEGSAQAAAAAMQVLKDVAKLPGLGLDEAIRGYTGLRAQGLNPAQSEGLLRQVGNANALNGGGQEQLGQAMLAIRQMLTKPFMTGEEINQLADALNIPVAKWLMNAYGTFDAANFKKMGVGNTDALETIRKELEKLPRAGNSAKNALENFEMALRATMVGIGGGVASYLVPAFGDFEAVVNRLGDSGILETIGQSIAEFMQTIVGGTSEDELLRTTAAMIYFTDQLSGWTYHFRNFMAGFVQILANWMDGLQKVMRGDLSGLGQMIMPIDENVAKAFNGKGLQGGMGQGIEDIYNDLRNSIDRTKKDGAPTNEGDPSLTQRREAQNLATNAYLAGIEQNTKRSAELQEMIMGGGNQGRLGLSAVDLSKVGRNAEQKIVDGIRELMGLEAMRYNRSTLRGALG